MRACRQHSTLTLGEQHSSNKRFADLTLRGFHEVFPMVSQHAKTQHSVIITTLLNFIKDHAERAECQGEWVIVLLLSIRLQNFTKCYNTNIFLAAQSFEVLLQMLQGDIGDMSPLYEPLIMSHPAGSQLITELLKNRRFLLQLTKFGQSC